MKIKKYLLNKLSFPDFEIHKMIFCKSKKRLEIFLDGAYLDIDGGKIFSKGRLLFFDYKKIEAKLYDDNKWKTLLFNDFDSLKSIEEFSYSKGNIYLRGFGNKTGKWIAYKLTSTKIEAEFI